MLSDVWLTTRSSNDPDAALVGPFMNSAKSPLVPEPRVDAVVVRDVVAVIAVRRRLRGPSQSSVDAETLR